MSWHALISTPNFFGIGEFWSGLIIGVLVLPLGAAVWFFFEDVVLLGGGSGDLEDDYRPDRPAAAGVLVCDYVNDSLLQTIAKQKEIEPEPKESERGREVSKEGSVGLEKVPILGQLSRRSSESERSRFEHREDHNVLLSSVLKELEGAGDLRRELAQAPNVSLGSPHVLDELASMAEQHSEAETAREALTTVQARLMANATREDFKGAVDANAFVLVEGPWLIGAADDQCTLTLKRLGPRRTMYGPDTEAVDMPPSVGLEVKIPRDQLSAQGKDRLDADEQTAAVFGVASKVQNGTLTLTPVAVFGRYGIPRESEIPRGAGAGYPDAC